jgi:hypothetical protein
MMFMNMPDFSTPHASKWRSRATSFSKLVFNVTTNKDAVALTIGGFPRKLEELRRFYLTVPRLGRRPGWEDFHLSQIVSKVIIL